MNHSMLNALVSMNAMQQKLDVIAGNIANVNTRGYKKQDATFQDILTNTIQQPTGFESSGRLSPLGYVQGWGAKLQGIQLNLEQGPMEHTGDQHNLAIEGNGLFEIMIRTPDGNGNMITSSAWTRDGSFKPAFIPGDPDNVYLTTAEGYFVKGTDDQPLKYPKNQKIRIDGNGNVFAYWPHQPETSAVQVGKVKLVRILHPQYLNNAGENYFTLGIETNRVNEVVSPIHLETNTTAKAPITVRQEYLEQSNVNLSDEMTDLIITQKAYQLNARALMSGQSMMMITNNLRG